VKSRINNVAKNVSITIEEDWKSEFKLVFKNGDFADYESVIINRRVSLVGCLGVPEIQGFLYFTLYNRRDLMKPVTEKVSVLKWFDLMVYHQIKRISDHDFPYMAQHLVCLFIGSRDAVLVLENTHETQEILIRLTSILLDYIQRFTTDLSKRYSVLK